MALAIQPQLLTFGQLINGRLFSIPNYQRAYSWGSSHRSALFDDINRTFEAGPQRSHFMATIVGLRRGTRKIIVDDYQEIDVVDGQQRLTTLILLMKSISKILDRTNDIAERIGRDLDEVLVKPDQASLLLLQTNHDTSHHFANYLREGVSTPSESASTLADRELLKAIAECEEFAEKWQREDRLPELVALVRNRLEFIFHETPDEALVYTVFEVLNSRGLGVSWVDRLKSMLMATIFETDPANQDKHISEVHRIWSDIYRCIGLRQGMSTEALRFAATLNRDSRPNRPLGQEDSVETLHGQSRTGPSEVIKTSTYMKSVTEAVDILSQDRRRNAITRIAQARLLAAAVHLRQDLSHDEKEHILSAWESVTFRIYGMFRKDARTAVGDYVRLAWRIKNEVLPFQDIVSEMRAIGKDYPIEKAIDELRGVDFYPERTEETRYVLARYEEHLAKQAGQLFDNEQWSRIWEATVSDSIDHILPQKTGDDGYVHRLGNLVLLPPKLNAQLGAKSPPQKAEAYRKTGLLHVQKVCADLPNWGFECIEKREEELLQWALQEWSGL